MQVVNLNEIEGADLECDLVIIGGGPAGLSIAKEFIGTPQRVLVLESGGLKEEPYFELFNSVEIAEDTWTGPQVERRRSYHGESTKFWSHDVQKFGVRCRALGGSTNAWAGKSAAFDDIDFARRPWVPHSGWPFPRAALDTYLDRAADFLNLGPNYYDERLWQLAESKPRGAQPDPAILASYLWQFARSRIDPVDFMRVGAEFMRNDADNVRVLLNATATQIVTNRTGTAFQHVEAVARSGKRVAVRAKAAVLAASAIENPRLLLASGSAQAKGLGNRYDTVGRYLMDHLGARIGRFPLSAVHHLGREYGFYSVRHNHRVFMYLRGLAPSAAAQEREQILNCALYLMPEYASDDPWAALKRLLRQEGKPLADMMTVAASPGLLLKGLARRTFQSNLLPHDTKSFLLDQVIRFNPNFVASEFQTGGLPHKLSGYMIDAIAEQTPDPDNRITLSNDLDALGMPLPRISWRVGDDTRRSITRLGQLLAEEFAQAGLPVPALDEWVAQDRLGEAVFIDMAHTAGTTRMSEDPRRGVVDKNCQVHGVSGLYVAGASTFPTSGHANPTLMIVALAMRLADHVKQSFTARVNTPMAVGA